MATDASERGLETLIVRSLIDEADYASGDPQDYDREYTVDLAQLLVFLIETQPEAFEGLRLEDDGPARRKFLARLQGEISKRGVIDVLRKGVKDGPHHVELFYGTPSPGNPVAAERYAQNRFSVTRQLRYSRDETQRARPRALHQRSAGRHVRAEEQPHQANGRGRRGTVQARSRMKER